MADDTDPRDLELERLEQLAEDRAARKYFEARQYGFTRTEAEAFRDSTFDIEDLRELVEGDCPVELAVRILAEA